MKYEKELSTAIELAQRAGELVMKYHDSENIGIETKPDNTPVTLADKASNKLILEGLRKEFPLDGIVSEEMEKIEGKRIWYIDPIDGTKGFIRKNGDFAVHIGLVEDKNPVLGVVYKPLTNEYFYGVKDFGAYKVENEVVKKLKISEEKTELRLIVSHNYDERDESKELVAKLNPSEIIKSGSEGLRLMKIVENIGDLRVTENANMCNTWDVCAPHAIVEAAGGIVEFLDGTKIEYFGQGTLGKRYVAGKSREVVEMVRRKLSVQ